MNPVVLSWALCLAATFAAALGTALCAQSQPAPAPAEATSYCADLKRLIALALTPDKLASVAGKPRDGSFLETTLPLTGWNDCSLYGTGTYTCDSRAFASAGAAENAQFELVGEIQSCLGEGWAEARNRSSTSYVVLRHRAAPLSITLSTDQPGPGRHVVRLTLFVRRN
jgi:hypothetical protein